MSFSQVSPSVKAKVKALTFEYSDGPQPNLLISVPNPCPDVGYGESLFYPEFTSLCPLSPSQPDYATLTIIYKPKDSIIELKSLKFYLVSYRQVLIFHEAVVSQILRDLVDCCQPKEMVVVGKFNVRGGIETTISARFPTSMRLRD